MFFFQLSLKSFTILTKLKETCTCNLACIKLSEIFRLISDSVLNLDLKWIRLSKGNPSAIFSFCDIIRDESNRLQKSFDKNKSTALF